MAALSSMIRMRRLASGAELAMGGLGSAARQLENECRTEARPVAGHIQRAAEFLRGECAAMQAEAMPVHSSREAVREQAGHIFRRNTHPIVDDENTHPTGCAFDAQGEKFAAP